MPVFYCALTQQIAVTTADTTTNATETPMTMPMGKLVVLSVGARAVGVDVVGVCGCVVLVRGSVLIGSGVLVDVRLLVCVRLLIGGSVLVGIGVLVGVLVLVCVRLLVGVGVVCAMQLSPLP